MKKIGITTFQGAYNYGAILQAYALQKTLSDIGNDVKIINYYNENIYDQYRTFRKKHHGLSSAIKIFIYDVYLWSIKSRRNKNFKKFISDNINLTDKKYEKAEIEKMAFDVIVTGSDQVWNKNITSGLDDIYTLNIENSAKKISYAASIGDNKILEDNKSEYKEKLQKLDLISVRETSTKPILEKVINRKVDVVLDPTLLRTKEEWLKIVGDKPLKAGKYIFAYSVGKGSDEFYKKAEDLAKKTGLEIIYFEETRFKRFNTKSKNMYSAGPSEFLNLLYFSEYVVTSSFHGLAFSTIFNKNVSVIFSNKSERLKTLMDTVGLKTENNSDWDSINKKLKEARKKSLKWLEEAVK